MISEEELGEMESVTNKAVGGVWERLAHDCSENDCSIYIEIAGHGHFILGAAEEKFILKARKFVPNLIEELRTCRASLTQQSAKADSLEASLRVAEEALKAIVVPQDYNRRYEMAVEAINKIRSETHSKSGED